MSKRIIYQCDRCHKTREQDRQPGDWPSITASFEPPSGAYSKPDEKRLWCEGCWILLRMGLDKEAK